MDEALAESNITYRTRTAFGRHFQAIAMGMETEMRAQDGSVVTSPYHYPALVEYMLGAIMPLA